jgi:mRNA interferase MazF
VVIEEASGSVTAYRHPYVVIQNNAVNSSRINTVIVCALTSNMRRARDRGNVTLEAGEANLPKPGVVNVTQLLTVDKSELTEKIGSLSAERVREILDGIALILEPRDE